MGAGERLRGMEASDLALEASITVVSTRADGAYEYADKIVDGSSCLTLAKTLFETTRYAHAVVVFEGSFGYSWTLDIRPDVVIRRQG